VRDHRVLLVFVVLTACAERPRAGHSQSASDTSTSSPLVVTPRRDTALPRAGSVAIAIPVPAAEQALGRYLGASVDGAPNPSLRDTIDKCPVDAQVEPIFTLAAFRVLSSADRGPDTAVVRAWVVMVAQEEGDPHVADRHVVTVRVANDTLHWTMVRDAASNRWFVCGISAEGYDFGHYGDTANSTFTPAGMTWRSIRSLADSIRRQVQPQARSRSSSGAL